jgi:hypothetical protein
VEVWRTSNCSPGAEGIFGDGGGGEVVGGWCCWFAGECYFQVCEDECSCWLVKSMKHVGMGHMGGICYSWWCIQSIRDTVPTFLSTGNVALVTRRLRRGAICAPLACSEVHGRESMRSTSLLQDEMMNDDAK